MSSWFNDPHDAELTDLIPFLADLTAVPDVRGILDGARWFISSCPPFFLPFCLTFGGQHRDRTTLHCWVVSLRRPLAKRPPHNTDPTLIFYTLRVYTIRRSATFLDIGFLGFALYIYLSLGIFLMVQCILYCPEMPSASFVDLSALWTMWSNVSPRLWAWTRRIPSGRGISDP